MNVLSKELTKFTQKDKVDQLNFKEIQIHFFFASALHLGDSEK